MGRRLQALTPGGCALLGLLWLGCGGRTDALSDERRRADVVDADFVAPASDEEACARRWRPRRGGACPSSHTTPTAREAAGEADCVAWAALPGVSVSHDALRECLAAADQCVGSLACERENLLVGSLPFGADCSVDLQCAGGLCVYGAGPGCGRCGLRANAGEVCDDLHGCDPSKATCEGSTEQRCQPRGDPPGASCSSHGGHNGCWWGYWCRTFSTATSVKGQCVPWSDEGGPCEGGHGENGPCNPGLRCWGEVCRKTVPVGSPCDAHCDTAGASCVDGQWKLPTIVGLGEPCGPMAVCKTGYCDSAAADARCVPVPPAPCAGGDPCAPEQMCTKTGCALPEEGTACTIGRSCDANRTHECRPTDDADTWVCVRQRGPGEACTQDTQCVAPLWCEGGRCIPHVPACTP